MNVEILVASDGDYKDDYGFFRWVIGTIHDVIGTAKVSCEAVHCRPNELNGRVSLLLNSCSLAHPTGR
jgi:hypothetical protein